jgi:glycosyltransferase involved in cell wall biosynthesis
MRLMAFIEAYTLTGPARNLLRFCRLASAEATNDCDISLVTFVRSTNGQPRTNAFIDEARASGLRIQIVTERGAFDTGVIGQLRQLFRKEAPDIIQTHSLKSHFLVRLTRPEKTPWIAFHHGYTTTDVKMHLYNQLDRWSLPAADRVVTVCSPFAEMLARGGVQRERIRVLQNTIEPLNGSDESAWSLRRRYSLPDTARIVLAIGRLSREKGHRHLIEAARLLQRSRPGIDFHILLVGNGPEKARLEAQVNSLDCRERVHFAGHQQNPVPFYSLADVFVLPSLTEGSPNVLLEAMMAKTPAVATAVGGVPEMVEDGRSALLVRPGDPAALAEAMAKLLDDPALASRLAGNAYADVLAQHSPQAYCASLLGIYRDLLGG